MPKSCPLASCEIIRLDRLTPRHDSLVLVLVLGGDGHGDDIVVCSMDSAEAETT